MQWSNSNKIQILIEIHTPLKKFWPFKTCHSLCLASCVKLCHSNNGQASDTESQFVTGINNNFTLSGQLMGAQK